MSEEDKLGQRPSEGIGKRLARFRQLSGMSARELAEVAGYGLTRGVIANIESGRKTEITVDQLIALSAALNIPPVALALPIDRPYGGVRLLDGPNARRTLRTAEAMDWFHGVSITWSLNKNLLTEGDAAQIAESIVRGVRQHAGLLWRLGKLEQDMAKGANRTAAYDETKKELDEVEAVLRRLRVDPELYSLGDAPEGNAVEIWESARNNG